MANKFHLPDIGEGLTEATIISWYVDVGEKVGLDEPLVEVETDKAVVDIPAPVAGVVLFHGGDAGDVIEVESLLAVVGEPGETWEDDTGSEAAPASAAAAPIVGTLDEAPATMTAAAAGINALPKVRRLATELGVDLESITGSGPGGRITEDDVRSGAVPTDRGPVERKKMSATRRAIADNLTRSWREIPHVTTYGEADVEALLAKRENLGKPVLEALLIEALVPVLQSHPEFNAAIAGDEIVFRKYYDIGVALDTPSGLMVGVVRGADQLSVAELDVEIRRLADGARQQRLTLDELRGQTFTLSNIGAVGGRFGTPIVPHGTAAILSVGRADPKPVVRNGEIVVGRELPISLSYDHRIIDGSTGRAFMGAVIEALESTA